MIVLTDVCQPGTKALDFVQYRDVQHMLDMGVSVNLLYCKQTGSLPKAWTKDEIDLFHSFHIGVIAGFERASTTPLKGRPQGIIDGGEARDACAIMGYPQGLPIIASVDTAVTSGNISVVRDYLLAFREQLAGHYQLGIYGGSDIISACLDISVCNQIAGAKSWSHNPPYPPAGSDPATYYRQHNFPCHFLQHISGSTPQYDMNDVLLASQMWLPHEVSDDYFPPNGATVTVETIEVLQTPERVYDTTDPKGPNPMQPLAPRNINCWVADRDWGPTNPVAAILHVTARANAAGTLLFYTGQNTPINNGRLTVASIALEAGKYCQSLVFAPVVNGNQVCAVSDTPCDLWFDLDGVGR